MRPQMQRLQCRSHKPRNAGGRQKPQEAKNGFSPRASGRRLALRTP